MNEELRAGIRKVLLRKLYTMGCWGNGHICESNLKKGFPPHLKGLVVEVADGLRKEGFLVVRPSSHDRQCYLNFAKKGEIGKIIGAQQTQSIGG
ncbi:Uncharacterised protein [uncultured archaeon]|nr:Uncharacterised protein [uncultured archaeon]